MIARKPQIHLHFAQMYVHACHTDKNQVNYTPLVVVANQMSVEWVQHFLT